MVVGILYIYYEEIHIIIYPTMLVNDILILF
ncbi:hypothetical protein IGI65_001729 [Enterococcus sp. DIV0755b]